MKLALSLLSAACIASLSLGAHGDEMPVAQPIPVVAASIEVEALPQSVVTLPFTPIASRTGRGDVAGTALPPVAGEESSNQAAASALADGVSTIGVLAAGGVELNPVMPSSPLGIVMMTAAKMGLARWANDLPDEERKSTLRSMNATFGGAAVNNILVLATAANPIALVGGLIAGVYFWKDTDDKLTAEAEAKATYYRALAAEHHRVTMLAYNARVQTQPVMASAMQVQTLAALDAPQTPPSALQLAQAFVAEVETSAVAQPVAEPTVSPQLLQPASAHDGSRI